MNGGTGGDGKWRKENERREIGDRENEEDQSLDGNAKRRWMQNESDERRKDERG